MADEKSFTQADLDAAIEKAVAKVQESVDRLEAKNAELVGDLRKARKATEIKPEDLTAAEERADKLEAALAEANKTVKTLTGERDKAVKALESESGFTRKLLVENGLREQLAANGVTNPIHQKAAMAMLAGQVEVSVEGDTRAAKVGDKALAAFVKEWAAGEEGKHFVAAPGNSGGGAPGAQGSSTVAKQIPRAEFDAMDAASRMAFIREGGAPVDA